MTTTVENLMQDIREAQAAHDASRLEYGDGGNMFYWRTPPTPWHTREWLRAARDSLTWTVRTLAQVADIDAAIIERLETVAADDDRTIETALGDEVMTLAASLVAALSTHFDIVNSARNKQCNPFVEGFLNFGIVLSEGYYPDQARILRTRRQELGLSLADVAARTKGTLGVDTIMLLEWRGDLGDHWYEGRALMAALEWPYLQLELVFGTDVKEADIDEWVRWRAEQDATAYRRAK